MWGKNKILQLRVNIHDFQSEEGEYKRTPDSKRLFLLRKIHTAMSMTWFNCTEKSKNRVLNSKYELYLFSSSGLGLLCRILITIPWFPSSSICTTTHYWLLASSNSFRQFNRLSAATLQFRTPSRVLESSLTPFNHRSFERVPCRRY